MLRVGLTGGVASGKTEVARVFADLGAGVVDTDVVAREVVAPGEPGLEAVRREFGSDIILSSGELDRRALRDVVFADAQARKTLESLLHPLIRARTLDQLRALNTPYAIAVVPLLVETDFGRLVDRTAVVDCPRETQIERLMQRDGLNRERARSMVNAQVTRAERLKAADDVIDNGGSRSSTRRQVRLLHSGYMQEVVCSTPRSKAK